MFTVKSKQPYWQQFSSYQAFQTVADLNAAVKQFVAFYDLTDAIKLATKRANRQESWGLSIHCRSCDQRTLRLFAE